MAAQPVFHRQYIKYVSGSYWEEVPEEGAEPTSRCLRLIYHSSHLTWHIKVTFRGTLQSVQKTNFVAKSDRSQHLMNLCHCIDLDLIRLLDDTVTELIIEYQKIPTTNISQWQILRIKKRPEIETEYFPIIDHLYVLVREDPFRVRFPVYDAVFNSVPMKNLSDIIPTEDLSLGVYKAHIIGDETTYVYKGVERPLYEPRDTETIEQELRNLILLRSVDGIVQLVAVVVSRNPYQTMGIVCSDDPIVVHGILLEYHSNGTLQSFLYSPKEDLPWHQWAIQITGALSRLHELGIAHMDLKPANIVVSRIPMKAILIDVSGVGGTSRDWLSPEMQSLTEPLSEDLSSRIQNDIWALGKIVSLMANATSNEAVQKILTRLSQLAQTELPPRIPLPDALSLLSQT